MLKWNSGPPPHIGWWNASRCREDDIWRWWDGYCWSLGANCTDSAELAATLAKCKDRTYAEVEWTHRYPVDARVSRSIIHTGLDRAAIRLPMASSPPPLPDDADLRQVLSFVEMAEYCFPVSAQPVLGFLRNQLVGADHG